MGDFKVVHCRRYLDILQKAGCDVFVLDLGRAGRPTTARRDRYLSGPFQGFRLFQRLFGRRMAAILSDRFVAFQLKLLMRLLRPDIVHVQWVGEWAWRMAKISTAPVVLTAWGTDINQTLRPDFDPNERLMIGETLSMASLVIGDSQDLLDQAAALASRPLRTLSLPIGIDTEAFRPGYEDLAARWRTALGIPPLATVILSPRALRENYGHDLIIEAFARTLAAGDHDLFLVIKAYDFRGTAYRADLNALIDRLGLAGRCRIVDEVAYGELPGLFAASDLVVNFPVMDAFPVTFLECAACETPILTNPLPAYTQHPMAPHLIFTDSRSAEGLSKRMTEALDALPQWREAARAARVFVREHFDEALTGQTLVSAYVTARLHD